MKKGLSFLIIIFLLVLPLSLALCVDEDGDGYGTDCTKGLDCDDTDSKVHPGASEQCGDLIDNNCDGQEEEGCGCLDKDGDGYGQECSSGIDCDDTNSEINPGAIEICDDSIDNNCDGAVDEGCSESTAQCKILLPTDFGTEVSAFWKPFYEHPSDPEAVLFLGKDILSVAENTELIPSAFFMGSCDSEQAIIEIYDSENTLIDSQTVNLVYISEMDLYVADGAWTSVVNAESTETTYYFKIKGVTEGIEMKSWNLKVDSACEDETCGSGANPTNNNPAQGLEDCMINNAYWLNSLGEFAPFAMIGEELLFTIEATGCDGKTVQIALAEFDEEGLEDFPTEFAPATFSEGFAQIPWIAQRGTDEPDVLIGVETTIPEYVTAALIDGATEPFIPLDEEGNYLLLFILNEEDYALLTESGTLPKEQIGPEPVTTSSSSSSSSSGGYASSSSSTGGGGVTSTGYCGDEICGIDEDEETCPEDCGDGGASEILTWVIIIIIVLVIIVGGIGGIAFYMKKRSEKKKLVEQGIKPGQKLGVKPAKSGLQPAVKSEVKPVKPEVKPKQPVQPAQLAQPAQPTKSPFPDAAKEQSVIDYIKAARAKNANDQLIRNTLKKGGWTDEQLNYAFSKV